MDDVREDLRRMGVTNWSTRAHRRMGVTNWRIRAHRKMGVTNWRIRAHRRYRLEDTCTQKVQTGGYVHTEETTGRWS
jgi:hypothetical protein